MAHILIIDDDEDVRFLLRDILEREGHEVRDASNGKKGLKLQRESPADLIITDIVMPEKEGIETIMELHREFPEVKIIAISGGGRNRPESYLRAAKKLGAHKTLEKPFERKDLLKTIRDVL